ncbi:unnamed protein product [Amoebophrya sp. A25]|nr:unnamed protein product [Amoebophrya sp. A25]|eukprot:GSA25T00021285001.1
MSSSARIVRMPLVSPRWVRQEAAKRDKRIVMVDATWYLPNSPFASPDGRTANEHFLATTEQSGSSFLQRHSVFLDLDECADRRSTLPHMMPAVEDFETHVTDTLHIDNHSVVVCYDRHGIFSAPRAWFMFRHFGHQEVFVLDGGLPAWDADEANGRGPQDGDNPRDADNHFEVSRSGSSKVEVYSVAKNNRSSTTSSSTTKPQQNQSTDEFYGVVDLSFMQDNVGSSSTTGTPPKCPIIDARPAGRFTGEVPEPRAGMRSGHMPGAANIPFGTLLTADKKMLPPAELQKVFQTAGVDPLAPFVATCGSGMTAAIVLLAAEVLRATEQSSGSAASTSSLLLYDGSWTEYGNASKKDAVEVVTGP